MHYQIFVDKLQARYNTHDRKLFLQSEIDSLKFDESISCSKINDKKKRLLWMVEYLSNTTPQLVNGFHTESNKIRYLCDGVFGKKWVAAPLKNISTPNTTSMN